jgi:hypothetical protein
MARWSSNCPERRNLRKKYLVEIYIFFRKENGDVIDLFDECLRNHCILLVGLKEIKNLTILILAT